MYQPVKPFKIEDFSEMSIAQLESEINARDPYLEMIRAEKRQLHDLLDVKNAKLLAEAARVRNPALHQTFDLTPKLTAEEVAKLSEDEMRAMLLNAAKKG